MEAVRHGAHFFHRGSDPPVESATARCARKIEIDMGDARVKIALDVAGLGRSGH